MWGELSMPKEPLLRPKGKQSKWRVKCSYCQFKYKLKHPTTFFVYLKERRGWAAPGSFIRKRTSAAQWKSKEVSVAGGRWFVIIIIRGYLKAKWVGGKRTSESHRKLIRFKLIEMNEWIALINFKYKNRQEQTTNNAKMVIEVILSISSRTHIS